MSIKRVETQVGHLDSTMGKLVLRDKKWKMLSQSKHVKAITALASDEEDNEVDGEITVVVPRPLKLYEPPDPFQPPAIKENDNREKSGCSYRLEQSTHHQPSPRQRDPGSFIFSIAFGSGRNATSMLDQVAEVNWMSSSFLIN